MSEIQDLLPEFLAEAAEIFEKVYQALDQLLTNKDDKEAFDAVFRGIHTIKGGSGMFNFENTKKKAHSLENELSVFKNNGKGVSPQEVELIRGKCQEIEGILKARDQLVPPPPQVLQLKTPQQEAPSTDFIRVPSNKINESLSAISEIFLLRNQMLYLVEKLKDRCPSEKDFFSNWDALDGSMRRAIGDLERTSMSMRMMSAENLFSRMERVVQSYSATANKTIHLKTEGAETELDKKVLDTLGEPLIHLVRNAMDHGIESSEKRAATGKPVTGTITLKAFMRGNEAIIQVKDDGKGMDPKAILESAKKKGIDVSQVFDDRSAIELIFKPGFSTAETVSDISGRGVGMDAVQSSVRSLGGRVIIDSEIGKGSTFSIELPVAMSLIPVVLMDINGYKYAVPNSDILQTKKVFHSEIKWNASRAYVQHQNQFIPIIDLRKKLDSKNNQHEENIRNLSLIIFQIINRAGAKTPVAAQVSTLDKTTEIVIKPNSPLSPQVPWINGVSVLPTGESVFVLSLAQLYQTVSLEEGVVHAA